MINLVAVYGSLRKGMGNAGLLDGCELVGEFTTQPKYKMFDLGWYPAVTPGGTTPILCEVYRVDAQHVARLDQLEGHPIMYKRTRIDTPFGPAYIYIYMRDLSPVAFERVASGDWVQHHDAGKPF